MKLLRRNTKVYYYASYIGKTEIKDENGNLTGESELIFSPVKTVRGMLSEVTGEVIREPFGSYKDYNAVLITDDITCGIGENDVLWLTKPPLLYVTPDTLPSSITFMIDVNNRKSGLVKKIARTKNVVSVAVMMCDP